MFCFFDSIQFLAFLANRYKNLENGKTLSSFFKYSPNIFSQNFPVRNETNEINETQEDDRFVIDEEYNIVVEK